MATIKDIEQSLNSLARKKGFDVTNVFVDLLDFIIGFFNPMQTPINGWAEKYGKEDNLAFHSMMCSYFRLIYEELKKKMWHDAWGDLFMSLHVKGNNNAQFFTPESLCDLMAQTSLSSYNGEEPTASTTFGKRIVINDCACGSARILLAAHSIFEKNGWKKPYLVCEDIDPTCCKMSAINMAVHCCFGEVICHDALCEPDKVRIGYVMNETMWPMPTNVPSIRPCNNVNRFFGVRLWKERKQEQNKETEAKQLTLF